MPADQRDTFDASTWSVDDIADYQAGVFNTSAARQVRELIERDPEARRVFDGLERTRRELHQLGTRYREQAPRDFVDEFFAAHVPAGPQEATGGVEHRRRPHDGDSVSPRVRPTTSDLDAPAPTSLVMFRETGANGGRPAATVEPPSGPRKVRRLPPIAAAAAVVVLIAGVIAAVASLTAPSHSLDAIATGASSPGRNNAISPDGAFLYLSNDAPQQVVIVDLKQERVQRTVAVPGHVEGMAAAPDGSVWVSTTGPGPDGVARQSVLSRISSTAAAPGDQARRVGQQAGAVSITPDGTLLWSVDNEIAFIDSDDLVQFSAVDVGGRADQLDVVDNGARAVANSAGSVVGLNLVIRAETDRFDVPGRAGPLRVAANPERPLYAVSSNSPDTVAIYSATDRRPLATIRIGSSATMTWPRNGSELYFTSSESSEVAAVSADNPDEVERLPVPPNPLDIISAPDGSEVYVIYANRIDVLPRQ